jgi:hypothetical protein
MFTKNLIANRGDNSRVAVAAKSDCLLRAAQAGCHASMETQHV